MSEVKIGKRFTIVIPKSIRKKLNLKEGQRVYLKIEGLRIIIEPLPSNPYEILGKIIGEPYDESIDEKRAGRWLMEHAGR
jgi:AbrB family looped-hinge helix DNA binding protein